MKKIISAILVVLILASSFIPAYADARIKGDIDGNGKVTVFDARKVLAVAAEQETISADKFVLYDMDGNGKITAMDARIVLKTAAGDIEQMPIIDDKDFDELVREKEEFIEREFLKLVNEERQKQGVGTLTVHNSLCKGAKIRAAECIEYFDHYRPNGEIYYTVLTGEISYNWKAIGENIAYIGEGYYDKEDILTLYTEEKMIQIAERLFTNFKNSPGHYKNMINGMFKETGFGVVIYYDAANRYIYVSCSHLFGTR